MSPSKLGNSINNQSNTAYITEQSLSDMIESIALVEAALSHILNAEGEKIQAIEVSGGIEELLTINRSINKTIANAIHLEQAYYMRLEAVNEMYWIERARCQEPSLYNPDYPCPDPRYPDPCYPAYPSAAPQPVVSVFSAASAGGAWQGNSAMKFKQDSCFDNKLTMNCDKCSTSILLPAGKKYQILYNIELENGYARPVTLEIRLSHNNTVLQSKRLFTRDERTSLIDNNYLVLDIPSGYDKSTLSVWLLSSVSLTIIKGKIVIMEL